jgi:hypothetical protein
MSPLPFYDKHIFLVAFLSVMLPALSCAIVLTLMEGVVKRYAKRKGESPIDRWHAFPDAILISVLVLTGCVSGTATFFTARKEMPLRPTEAILVANPKYWEDYILEHERNIPLRTRAAVVLSLYADPSSETVRFARTLGSGFAFGDSDRKLIGDAKGIATTAATAVRSEPVQEGASDAEIMRVAKLTLGQP